MAVSEVTLAEIGASCEVTGTTVTNAKTSYSANWNVICSDPTDGPALIRKYFRNDSSLPFNGRSYRFADDFDTTAFCKSLVVSRESRGAGFYRVQAKFEPLDAGNDGQNEQQQDENGNLTDDPISWAEEIQVSYTQITVPVEKAIYIGGFKGKIAAKVKEGAEVCPMNSAGVPFDPPLEKEENIKVIRFSRNVRAYNGDLHDEFQDAINSENITVRKNAYRFVNTWRKHTALIKNIDAVHQFANGLSFWKEAIEVWVKRSTWIREVVDRGLARRQWEGDLNDAGKTISASDNPEGFPFVSRLKDAAGYPITEPILLDGDGQPLLEGRPPVFIKYRTNPEKPFARLSF